MANHIKGRVPARLQSALRRLAELDLGDLIELGPNHSIEEEAFSEVTGALTDCSNEQIAFLFPERLWLAVGDSSTAAKLTAHLVRCGAVRRERGVATMSPCDSRFGLVRFPTRIPTFRNGTAWSSA